MMKVKEIKPGRFQLVLPDLKGKVKKGVKSIRITFQLMQRKGHKRVRRVAVAKARGKGRRKACR